MLSKRENYLIAAKGGKPEFIPSYVEDTNMFFPMGAIPGRPGNAKDGGLDFLNIRWIVDEYGSMADVNWRAIEELRQWRDPEIVKFPDVKALNWKEMAAAFQQRKDPEKVTFAGPALNGLPSTIFMTAINMMGIEDGLCAIYEEPEELEALISALTDYNIELIYCIGEYIKPDIIGNGDDVAAASGPFISKEIWTKMYKPYFKKIMDAIHEVGALAEFHCCGSCDYLIDEFIDIGADICQLPQQDKELAESKKKYGNRLVITGGWDNHLEGAKPGASEAEVRSSLRKGLDEYGKDGALIFYLASILGNSEDAQNKRKWINDEFNRYRYEIYR